MDLIVNHFPSFKTETNNFERSFLFWVSDSSTCSKIPHKIIGTDTNIFAKNYFEQGPYDPYAYCNNHEYVGMNLMGKSEVKRVFYQNDW